MFSFSNLFGSPAKKSPLEVRLQRITLDDAARTYEAAPDPDLRVPGAISMTVLKMAHSFSQGVLEMEADFDLGEKRKSPNHQSSYDAAAFEAAAYAHFWTMKDHLQAEVDRLEDCIEEDEDDNEDNSGKQRYAGLVTATLISDIFIKRYTTFDLPDRYFAHRAMSYCRSCDTQIDVPELIGRFEHNLTCSILAGKPVHQKESELHLALGVVLKTYIPIFHANSLSALSELVETLFADSEKGAAGSIKGDVK
jgi:hypothetical protein